MKTNKYPVGKIEGSNIDLDNLDFAVDTAGSWDGDFPDPDKGDFIVTIGSKDTDDVEVLVSRRYTEAVDAADAASLALNAFAERHDYETDDEGNLLEIEIEEAGPGLFAPAWVNLVEAVTSPAVRCESGQATGERCDWRGDASELEEVEWMPEHLRESHRKAGNAGRHPHNGSIKLKCCPDCIEMLAEQEG